METGNPAVLVLSEVNLTYTGKLLAKAVMHFVKNNLTFSS